MEHRNRPSSTARARGKLENQEWSWKGTAGTTGLKNICVAMSLPWPFEMRHSSGSEREAITI